MWKRGALGGKTRGLGSGDGGMFKKECCSLRTQRGLNVTLGHAQQVRVSKAPVVSFGYNIITLVFHVSVLSEPDQWVF